MSARTAGGYTVLLGFILALVGCHGGPGRGKLPAPLERIESGAEDIFDQIEGDQLPLARQTASTVDSTWKSYRTRASHDGAPVSALEGMDQAVAALGDAGSEGNPLALKAAANKVSLAVPELARLYHPRVPVATLRLDARGRALLVDADRADFAAASDDLDRLDREWKRFRPEVAGRHDGEGAAVAFDLDAESVRTAVAAGDADLLRDSAHNLLDTVDALERVFLPSTAP